MKYAPTGLTFTVNSRPGVTEGMRYDVWLIGLVYLWRTYRAMRL